MNIPDHIFDEALVRLRKGESISQITDSFKDYQEELDGLLSVAQMGVNIPKLVPPTPYKAHRFASIPHPANRFFEMLSLFRVAAVPISLVIALLGGSAVVSATENSLPGDTFYSLKRATEQVRLSITKDQNKVATIHVELMQKRLDEVKKAAENGNDATETLAIAELKSQTEKTFAQAGPVATANAITNQDSSLLNNLVAVNKEQKDVLAELSLVGDSDSAKTIATSALADSKKNDQALAKIIATVNDQVLADLPNKVSVTGSVTLINNKITVEKNTFTINDKTVINNPDGTTATEMKLITGRATVIGTKLSDGTLIAKQIQILSSDDGAVKGEVIVTQPPVVKPPVTTDPLEPAEEPIPTIDPTKAQGSFITEPSDSQYTP
jgi:hypothetical protein